MIADLEVPSPQVHEAAKRILAFWFEELDPNQHWTKSATLDQAIEQRFSGIRNRLIETVANGWRATPDTLLAAVIATDQFSRNIHRDKGEAFAGDGIARELTLFAIVRGDDLTLPEQHRVFLYMPLMHAEDMALQRLSMKKFDELGIEEQVNYARGHAEVIDRFGRFPSRNRALGRRNTALEKEYLSQPGAGW
jgi:uncharacterized protein (DUF924 family)